MWKEYVMSQLPVELRDEDGNLGIMGAAVLAIISAGIMLMLGSYINTKLASNINDTGVTAIKTNLNSGYEDASDFPGLVLIFVFISVILGVIATLRG